MEIKGKIKQVLEPQGGTKKDGNAWTKQEYIIESGGKYPKDVCFAVWGDKIAQFDIKQGDEVTISIEIESREFNEKWYTNIQAWRVVKGDVKEQAPSNDITNIGPNGPEEDDLPF